MRNPSGHWIVFRSDDKNNRMKKLIKTISAKRVESFVFKPTIDSLGFRYTEADEIAIERACRISEKWMTESYGKGSKPHKFGIGDR